MLLLSFCHSSLEGSFTQVENNVMAPEGTWMTEDHLLSWGRAQGL